MANACKKANFQTAWFSKTLGGRKNIWNGRKSVQHKMWKALALIELVVTELWLTLQAQSKFAHIFTWKQPASERESIHTTFPFLVFPTTTFAYHSMGFFPQDLVWLGESCGVDFWWTTGEMESWGRQRYADKSGQTFQKLLGKQNEKSACWEDRPSECILCSVSTSNPGKDGLEEYALRPG